MNDHPTSTDPSILSTYSALTASDVVLFTNVLSSAPVLVIRAIYFLDLFHACRNAHPITIDQSFCIASLVTKLLRNGVFHPASILPVIVRRAT